MKKFLLLAALLGLIGLTGLTACVPQEVPVLLAAPPEAGAFARFKFAAPPEKVFPSLRDSVESGTGDFLITGVFVGRDGVTAFWQKVGGQSARVYFTIKADAENTLVKISTVPGRAPEPQLLARSLNLVGNDVADRLNLKEFTLEPDR
jgi:hypothetical protein